MASIRNRNGKWEARLKRNGITAQKTFLNKRDAEKWAVLTEAEIERNEYTPPTKKQLTTLNELLEQYAREVSN